MPARVTAFGLSTTTTSHRRPLRAAPLVALIILLAVAAGCGGGGSEATTSTGGASRITVYSGQHEQTIAALTADFTKRTGIGVDLRSGSEGELANTLIQEGDRTPADVFIAGNSPALQALAGRDLLAPVAQATLAQVSPADSPASGMWVGVSARASVLAYNTDALKQAALPTSLLDLAGNAWKGKIAYAPTETDFQPLLAAITALQGRDAAKTWLKSLDANAKRYDDNEAIIAAVNRGEVQLGLIENYYWYRLRDELGVDKMNSAIQSFAPGDPGALVTISGAGILRASKRSDAAQRFVAYLVSADAQRLIASSTSYEYPLRPGVVNSKLTQERATLRPPAVGIAQLGDGGEAFALMQEAGIL